MRTIRSSVDGDMVSLETSLYWASDEAQGDWPDFEPMKIAWLPPGYAYWLADDIRDNADAITSVSRVGIATGITALAIYILTRVLLPDWLAEQVYRLSFAVVLILMAGSVRRMWYMRYR